jgi:hypothetical protein
MSELVSALNPTQLVMMSQIGYYVPHVPGATMELLSEDNFIPGSGQAVTYMFTRQAEPLRPQYERMLPGRVTPVGRAFLVTFEAADWSWLRTYGWRYTCGGQPITVPFLFSLGAETRGGCPQRTYTWSAQWHGPDAEMVLQFSGPVRIEVGAAVLFHAGFEQSFAFTIPANSAVTVVAGPYQPTDGWPSVALLERSPGGLRAPDWDQFTPSEAAQDAAQR